MESMTFRHLIMAAVVALGLTPLAGAEPTHVVVRARSLDAKFIGAHMGGVSVTLTDVATGQVLAEGQISGGTGDTAKIMQTAPSRFDAISDEETAGFTAVLDLEKPTLVRADAHGPLGHPASAISVSSMMWVIPGRDITGDGWVLTFPGLAIEAEAAPGPDGATGIKANITLMCGCPITPGGLWDSNDVSVDAYLLKGETVIATTALAYAGSASQFAGQLPPAEPGDFTLRVIAASRKTPNAGVIEKPLTVPARN
jgi:hypothetical protein